MFQQGNYQLKLIFLFFRGEHYVKGEI